MIKRIIIYILIAIIICMGIKTKLNYITLKDNYIDYFVRGYCRACMDRGEIEKYPSEERTMELYMKFAKRAMDYIKEEVK